ncbi:type IV toxin-antitoxin system AbiEi family antitoxin domain-containing protein [Nocardioides sp. SYSU DS0663]|uniref:type IV toxin-antitoxin system AbiEi family antitoxin domain-containing protein n=1 Tax=Nocardioides sp. SYSU DS0663 TaxID=3416445 RepID=UPI003F4B5FCD
MHPAIAAAFRRPPHLVRRRTVLAAGMTEREVDRLVRTGSWVAVRRGVYAERERVAALATRSERQRLHDDAAALATRLHHVRSHESAAVVWGMAIPLPATPVTHLTVPVPGDARSRPQRSRFRHGVKHHLAPYGPVDRPTTVDGVPVLGMARTAVDVAREHGLLVGVTAVDAALRAGVSATEVWDVVARMRSWPCVNVVRQAIELSDPGSESVGESLARLLVEELGRGRPETQFGLADDGRVAFVDLRLGRHLIEFDGRQKYGRDGGDGRAPEDVVWEEKRRQDWLCGHKLGMSRLVWDDVWGRGRDAARVRLEREVADTDARFGTDISDLAPYRVRQRRPPPAA